jgi:hypothetical protein
VASGEDGEETERRRTGGREETERMERGWETREKGEEGREKGEAYGIR